MDDAVSRGFDKAGLATARRHLFLCLGPDCCSPTEGEAAWESLKAGVRDLGLPVMRTRAGCFRVCSGGPWLVVYPEGIWYGGVTPERCARILREHIGEDRPVREWIAQKHPLPHPLPPV